MAEVVDAPDGRTWTVRRRLAPRLGSDTLWARFHRRFRAVFRGSGRVADADPGCLLDIGEGLTILIAIVVLLFVAIPLVVALVEVLGLVLLALVGIGARIVLRRPWVVEASAAEGERRQWRVVGWRASGDRVREVAQALQAGIVPPADAASAGGR